MHPPTHIAVLLIAACARVGFDGIAVDAVTCTGVGPDDDGDGHPDSCDVCPHFPDVQSDTDTDGVGDACDPSSTASHRIVLFEPFAGTTLDPRWRSYGLPVTVANSEAHFDALGGTAVIGYDAMPATTEIAMRGRVLSIGPTPRQLSLQFATNMTEQDEYCEIYDDGFPNLKLTRSVGNQTFEDLRTIAVPALVTGSFTMRFRHDSSGFSCEVAIGGTTYSIASPSHYAATRNLNFPQFIGLDVAVESFAEIEAN